MSYTTTSVEGNPVFNPLIQAMEGETLGFFRSRKLALDTLKSGLQSCDLLRSQDFSSEIRRLRESTEAADPGRLKKIVLLKVKRDLVSNPAQVCENIDQFSLSEEELVEVTIVAACLDAPSVCRNIAKFKFEKPANREKVLAVLASVSPKNVWKHIEKFAVIPTGNTGGCFGKMVAFFTQLFSWSGKNLSIENAEKLFQLLLLLVMADPEGVFDSLDSLTKLHLEPRQLGILLGKAITLCPKTFLAHIDRLVSLHPETVNAIAMHLSFTSPLLLVENAPKFSTRSENLQSLLEKLSIRTPHLVFENIEKLTATNPDFIFELSTIAAMFPDLFVQYSQLIESNPQLAIKQVHGCASTIHKMSIEQLDKLGLILSYVFIHHPHLIPANFNHISLPLFYSLVVCLAVEKPELSLDIMNRYRHGSDGYSLQEREILGSVIATIFVRQPSLVLKDLKKLIVIDRRLIFHWIDTLISLAPHMAIDYMQYWLKEVDEKEKLQLLKALIEWDVNVAEKYIATAGLDPASQEELIFFTKLYRVENE